MLSDDDVIARGVENMWLRNCGFEAVPAKPRKENFETKKINKKKRRL